MRSNSLQFLVQENLFVLDQKLIKNISEFNLSHQTN